LGLLEGTTMFGPFVLGCAETMSLERAQLPLRGTARTLGGGGVHAILADGAPTIKIGSISSAVWQSLHPACGGGCLPVGNL